MLHVRTPVVRSTVWSNLRGQDVWLKLDAVQPTGSFKIRGLGHAAEQAVARGATGLLSSSGGNAGLAAAYAARCLGVPITVVVPQRTGALMRQRIAAEGANVVVHGEVWDDAHAHALALAGPEQVLVHPFDDPDVWTGNASLVHELAHDLPERPGTLLVAVGGGVDMFVVPKRRANPQIGSRPHRVDQRINITGNGLAAGVQFENLGPSGHESESRRGGIVQTIGRQCWV